MAIDIIDSPRRMRRFITYDMEWVPGTLKVRIIGVFDGVEYRRYYTVQAFLDGELTHKNRGKWFYAHAGGLADVQFVIRCLRDDERYSAEASFSGSSAFIVTVRRGHNVWKIVDSYWLLRDKLANVAKWIGMEKGGPAKFAKADDEAIKEWYATIPIKELMIYNEQDCVILWNAIRQFEDRLLSYGGELMATLASCAMRLFRRRYLKSRIETDDMINDAAREAYFASRVEVYERRWLPRGLRYNDVNSSFPYAMTFPLPGELIAIGNRLPDDFDRPYIALVDVNVRECYLTSTPVRLKERVFFPVGRFTARLSDIDIQELLNDGGYVEKVYEVFLFEPFHDLGPYARDLYRRRQKTKDVLERQVFKLLLNSLYGKFAETTEKLKAHINPRWETLQRLSFENQIMPGVFLEQAIVKVRHSHVPLAVHITAIARRTLTRYLRQAGEGKFFYCDTDGFATTHRFKTGKGLGELKLETITRKRSIFVLPKLYRIDDKVKAKGFSLGRDKKKAIERFEQLLEGKEIEVERMIRLRENMRAGLLDPRETIIHKRLSQKAIPKRFTYPDGKTRPWTIEELKERT